MSTDWRVYCLTDQVFYHETADIAPTLCPVHADLNINPASISGEPIIPDIAIDILERICKATSTTYVSVSTLAWHDDRYGNLSNGKLVYCSNITDRNLDMRLYDVNNTTVLMSTTSTASEVKMVDITLPVSDTYIELQIKKSGAGGVSPIIEGVSLHFDR